MNCYTDSYGDKYYCLDPINPNCQYLFFRCNGEYLLICRKDSSKHLLHRIDGPSIEYTDGSKYWCFNGNLHREDGPAVYRIYDDHNEEEWYYHGEQISCKSNEEFLKIIERKKMSKFESEIRSTVCNFVSTNTLFTALDISNKVKETYPEVYHSVVSSTIKEIFDTDIKPFGYTTSVIDVTLSSGGTASAILYHPVSDIWDIDSKYDAQKRNQESKKITTTQVVIAPIAPTTIVPIIPPPPQAPWNVLFSSTPSLFPAK